MEKYLFYSIIFSVIKVNIVKEETSKPSYLSIYHIAINLIGYISLYNGLVSLYKQVKDNKNLNNFMTFANTAMLKDMAIELNELYLFSESISPNVWDDYSQEHPEFNTFRRFLKKLRNNMKFFPKQKVIDDILEKSKNKYPTNILKRYENDIVYYCGYFLGENLIFGSNLYYEYVFYEPLKLCKQDGDLYNFTNSISSNLETFYRTFEKILFKDGIDIPEVKLKERKRFFQIYNQTTKFKKMLSKSKYDKSTLFIFMILIEEISGMEIYLDYMLDLNESIKNPILLYFFTQFVAIKYDQIRDAIEFLINDGAKFGVSADLLKDEILKLNIFKKNTTDFAWKLRNFHHFTEVEKYKLEFDKNETTISVDFANLYKMVTDCDDLIQFKDMLFKMKEDLNILVQFLRKNIGIRY